MTGAGSKNDLVHEELLAIREVAHALIVSDRPEDVYQFALDRVTPLLGAQFSLVLTLGADGTLLRPVAQHQWPEPHSDWIGALRVRVGNGPSGLAVQERRIIWVPDLFARGDLSDWYEVATELGFRSILALPLMGSRGPIGAVSFYFVGETGLLPEHKSLARSIANQLAVTAEKAALISDLRRSNAALAEANEQLEQIANDAAARQILRDRFSADALRQVSLLIKEGTDASLARAALISACAAGALKGDVGRLPAGEIPATEHDARTPLLAVVARCRTAAPTVPIHLVEPTVTLPLIEAGIDHVEDVLELILAAAIDEARAHSGSVNAAIGLERGFIAWRISWPGVQAGSDTPVEIRLAQQMAQLLGGAVHISAEVPDDLESPVGQQAVFVLPTEVQH